MVRRLWFAFVRRCAGDRGSMIVEAVVASFVFAVAIIGVVGSMGAGLNLVGNSRQRSGGVAIAQERLERAHSLPYNRVALYCGCQGAGQPAHSNDPKSPDNAISADGTSYTVESGTTEPILFDSTVGAVKHIDDPVTLGKTEYNIYQYVTWVDDPNVTGTNNYKRLVVIVTWKFPLETGPTNRVTQSSLIGRGTVSVPTPPPTPTPSSSSSPATPTPPAGTPTPTPTPVSYPGDTTGPTASMTVISGAGAAQGYTNSTNVQVQLSASDTCRPIHAKLQNDPSADPLPGCPNSIEVAASSSTDDLNTSVSWTIPDSEGPHQIRPCFLDGATNRTALSPASLYLDKTNPTTPANLRKSSCALSGNNRQVSLAWDASTDNNLVGYRLYKSINSGGFAQVTTTTAVSISDTDLKSYDSVRYLVRAYDKAGNESGDSNVLPFSKNSC